MDARLMTHDFTDGMAIARERIAAEARARTGVLDLSNLGLEELPRPLFALDHLHTLWLGDGWRGGDDEWVASTSRLPPNRVAGDLARLAALPGLSTLSIAGMAVEDLGVLAGLRGLRMLDCARTGIGDLAPAARMAGLTGLDYSGTQVDDLRPLAEMAGLEVLRCAYTPLDDLGRLAALRRLAVLDCSSTDVPELAPLGQMVALRHLDFSYTRVGDLAAVSGLSELRRVAFASVQVSDLATLAEIGGLQRVDCSYTQIEDLGPLARIAGLQWVQCAGTQVSDLSPLAALGGLQVLLCSDTPVEALAPLAAVGSLRALECSHTRITTLVPLAGLGMLQVLHCSGTEISDLAPLAALRNLQVLYCSSMPVADLSPLAGLGALQVLSCAHTAITRLEPLRGLTALREFSCADTAVTDLAPLAGLAGLQWLSCADTRVGDLSPVADKQGLRWLSCAASLVSDLAPLAGLPALEWLDASGCQLRPIPAALVGQPRLRELYTFRASSETIPGEVLSQTKRDNCLPALRAHFADLEEGAERVTDVKLVILGNGRVGKTQLSRRLRQESFQAEWDSTHGIAVRPGELPEAEARLQIWDFGGQDIYHGTHTLFLRTRAIFVIAWAADVEATPEYEHQGIRFRNHPLEYWVDYARQFGDPESPVLIVQTKCDAPGEGADSPPLPGGVLERFAHLRVLRYSSATDLGRAELDAALGEAVGLLRQRESAASVTTGAGRMRVRRRIEALREADADRPAAERLYRTLDRETFLRICDEEGGVGSITQLLAWLNNAGVIFYRRGLFHDRIILDQAWALDAVYAVFQRDKCYRQIRARNGRFDRKLLENLVWQGYSEAEQMLFLSMMASCGICFVHRPGAGSGRGGDAAEYIAPDLLPARAGGRGSPAIGWDEGVAWEEESYAYSLLPPGLMGGLIARVGGLAGAHATYWRDAVYGFETSLRAHLLIEQVAGEGWGGWIRVRTQGGDAAALLARMAQWMEEAHADAGLDLAEVGRVSSRAREDMIGAMSMDDANKRALVFGPPPVRRG